MASVLGGLASCAEGGAPFLDQPAGDEIDGELAEIGARTGDVRLRLMAANITSDNDQGYHDPGIRIFKGVAPDVVMIQEFNVGSNTDAAIRAFVDNTFGAGFFYYREAGAQIPNGVISRWPIIESGEWDDANVGNRDFAWARIDIPGPVDLFAISVHLLTSSAENRNAEANALVAYIQQRVPAGSYLVLGGDFNTKERTEAALGTLGQVFTVAAPWPADSAGNDNTNAGRNHPYDWVLANPALQALMVPTVIGSNTFSGGLVADTRVYTPIGDIVPAQAGDSGATNMQHMGIVRDFLIRGDAQPEPTVRVVAPNGGESWASGSVHDLSFSGTGLTVVKVEVALDGTTFTTVAASVPATAGKVSWTVPAFATTSARVRVSDAATGRPTDTSDGPFTITLPDVPTGKLFINEVLANEPGADQAGEFVELVNGTTAEIDLANYTISDLKVVRHKFAAGTKLAPGRAVVVYGAATGIPANVQGAIAASTGLLSLTNTADTVTLKNAAGTVVDTLSYTSALAPRDGLSMNRSPDASPAGTFVLHDTISSAPSSPGKHADGTVFGDTQDPGPGPGPGPVTAESEPNDTAPNGPLTGGVAVTGSVSTATDVDFYKVTAGAGRLSISLAIHGGADLDWYLYREGNTSTYLARGYTTNNPETGALDVTAGTYLIKVVGYKGAVSSYGLTVSGPVTP